VIHNLVGKLLGEPAVGRRRRKWEDNIKQLLYAYLLILTASRSCSRAGFDISHIEPSKSATRIFVSDLKIFKIEIRERL
jgi:hypothetical protein